MFGFKLGVMLVCFVFLSSICFAQKPPQTRKEVVNDFLEAWMVRKDITTALQFFHEKAFLDDSVLDCGCCSHFKSETEFRTPEAIKSAVSVFLGEDFGHIKGTTLKNVLFLTEDSEKLAKTYKKWVLNQPEHDKYYIVSYRALNSRAKRYLGKQYNLKSAFFNVIQFRVLNEDVRYGDDVLMYLFWVRDKNGWKIGRISVACN
ncbi:MAG TPA: hypothetical protein VF791_14620 [Pyrinomonadaceae bacterium]